MKGRVLGVAAAVGALAIPATGYASELPGDVAPFGENIGVCNMPHDQSDEREWNITEDHIRPLVLVSSTGDPNAGGNADFSVDENDQGVWETYWTKNPVTFWREARTMRAGLNLHPMGMECWTSDLPWRVNARWFDRPITPATFNADAQSVVGFRAMRRGHYVADVVPSKPISVAMQEHHTGEYSSVIPEHDVSGVFERPGQLDLGELSAGDHDLTVRGYAGCLCYAGELGAWSVTIREAGDAAKPSPEPSREADATVQTHPEQRQPEPPAPRSHGDRVPIVVRRGDRLAPHVGLSVARKHGLRTLRVRCDEHCSLRVVVRGRRYVRTARRELPAGRVLAIRVRARGQLRVTAVAVGRGHNRRVLRKLVR